MRALSQPILMPRWVVGSIVLACWSWLVIAAVACLALLSQLPIAGEPPFTPRQRAYLEELWPEGVYTGAAQFRYCNGGVFWFIDSSTRQWSFNNPCAGGMPKR